MRGFDFTPALGALVLAFTLLGTAQFVAKMPQATHGLLLFEKACPVRQMP